MVIREVRIEEKEAFNKAATHPLQSWQWGEFRKKARNSVLRFGVFYGEKLKGALQLTLSHVPYTNLKIGTLIKGPRPTREVLQLLREIGKKENAIFIKLEPNYVPGTRQQALGTRKLLRQNGCVPGKTLFTPSTFWIDLTKSEEELMASFHPKTRYNIRVAQRNKVEVVEDNSDAAFEKYIELMRETVKRQGFYAHTEKYHRLMWKVLHKDMVDKGENPIAHLLTAKYTGPPPPKASARQSEIITTWILFVWHDFLYYPYGASTDKYKNLMANNLMMWEAIRFGKRLGLKTFDLWGREPGTGFTRFKEGYSPQVVEFIGTWDLPTSPLYWPYRAVDTIRWAFLRIRSKFVKPRF